MWGCVSLLLNMHKKRISTEYSPKDAPYTSPLRFPLLQTRYIFVAMGTQRSRRKKHCMEYKLSNIIEVLRLS
jgi:hypothetical protein